MSAMMISNPEVVRPDIAPLTSSVLDHATTETVSRFGLRNNEGLWVSYNCADTLVPTPICPNPMVGFKEFQTVGWIPAFEFAYMAGVQCSSVGLDPADQRSEIERVFALNEGKGIERALLANRFVATDSDADVQWDGPVDLTPSAAITPAIALALLEGYAAANYAGQPTIHMPRALAILLGEKIVWDGDKAYTRTGAKVAIGGGYDDEGVPADGKMDMFATGEVYVERGETLSFQSWVIPGDGSGIGSGENGLEDNTTIALVERLYRVAVDCFVAKATATVW